MLSTDKTPVYLVDNADDLVAARIDELLQRQPRVILALDGCCASGKTTTAGRLGGRLSAAVFHMDDYFLQPQMRTPERLRQPGGNVDAERCLSEVLLPVSRGEAASVRRFDCRLGRLLDPVCVSPARVTIVEGAYSLHPLLAPYYDLRLFLRIDPALQAERILARNGKEELSVFQTRWIPLENAYFSALDIEQSCDIVVTSTERRAE